MSTKHWKYWSTEYSIWCGIKQRCLNKNHDAYERYGGRWITMCKEWEISFQKFYDDVWDRPGDMTLDRINNELWYYKENCKWSTRKEQQNNTKKNIKCLFRWEILSIKDFADFCGLSKQTVRYRLWDWLSCEEIFSESQIIKQKKESAVIAKKEIIPNKIHKYINKTLDLISADINIIPLEYSISWTKEKYLLR